MPKGLIFLTFLFFCAPSCQASFRIYVDDEAFRAEHPGLDASYTCDIFVRQSSDDMCKMTLTYSPLRDSATPFFSCLKVPNVVMIQLTYSIDKAKTLVENIVRCEKKENSWWLICNEVITNAKKTEYKLLEELTSTSIPSSLKIRIKNPKEKTLISLPKPDLIQFN